MLLWIANPRFLYSFVIAFIATYAVSFSSFTNYFKEPTFYEPAITFQIQELKPLESITLAPLPTIVTLDYTDYRNFSLPTGEGSRTHFEVLFKEVSNATGINEMMLYRFVSLESSFEINASPGGTNSAKGLFQFTDDTWGDAIAKFGKLFNIDESTSVWDPRANTLMAAMRLKDAQDLLERVFPTRTITETDLYLTHFLGRTGAIRFLKADSNAVAAVHMPAAARRNRNIFYDDGRRARKARTYNQIYTALNDRFETKAIEFGLV